MNTENLWKNGVVLSFDLDTNLLKQYYSKTSPQNAYTELKKFLLSNNFEHKKDSDYINVNIDKFRTVELIREFSKINKWFAICVNKINISPNVQSLDICTDIKSLIDENFKNEKDIENKIKRKSLLKRINSKKQIINENKKDDKHIQIKDIEK